MAQRLIASLAANTDAETSLTFKTTAYTRANPWEKATASTPTTEIVTGFVLPPGTRRFNGELVALDKRVIYVAAADLTTVTPGLATTVTIAGKEFPTSEYYRWPEGDNPALYEIMVDLG